MGEKDAMKKVGIVTTVGYDNYGNLLQNYAVTKLIENLGYCAVTLNNECEEQDSASFEQVKGLVLCQDLVQVKMRFSSS